MAVASFALTGKTQAAKQQTKVYLQRGVCQEPDQRVGERPTSNSNAALYFLGLGVAEAAGMEVRVAEVVGAGIKVNTSTRIRLPVFGWTSLSKDGESLYNRQISGRMTACHAELYHTTHLVTLLQLATPCTQAGIPD
jgi:hypothetical protein